MKQIEEFVEHKFKNRIESLRFEKYKIMAAFLDDNGKEALSWDAEEASVKFMNFAKGKKIDYIIGVYDWQEFLSNNIVSRLLTDLLLRYQQITLRKLIDNLNDKKDLTQGQIKALDALSKMVEKADDFDTMTYVQYTCPIRFDDTDLDEIVDRYGKIDE